MHGLDAARMEIPQLFSAITVHRHLVVEGTLVRDNPFYTPGEKFIGMSPEDRERDLRDVFREVGFDLGNSCRPSPVTASSSGRGGRALN